MRIGSMAGRACGALLLFALAWPSAAQADVAVAAPSCEGLDFAELRSLLEVEIGSVAAEWREVSTPVVLLGCTGDRVRLEITDPVTDKSVARTIAMPEVDRERVLAIAVAQLFLTSWLELLVDGDHEAGPGAEEAERRAREAVEEAIEAREQPAPEAPEEVPEPEVPEPEAEPSEPTAQSLELAGELSIDGGLRWRTEGEQLLTGLAALRGLFVIERALLVGVRAAMEWGRASRMRGTVDLYNGALGLVAGWRSPEAGPFSLDIVAIASLEWLAFDGQPSSPAVRGGTTVAVVGELALELAPAIRAGPVRVALPLSVSGVGFAPDGVVSGEAPVVAGGPVFSAALRVSVSAPL